VYHRAFALHDPLDSDFVHTSVTFALRGIDAEHAEATGG
jgi:hypothetical protein